MRENDWMRPWPPKPARRLPVVYHPGTERTRLRSDV